MLEQQRELIESTGKEELEKERGEKENEVVDWNDEHTHTQRGRTGEWQPKYSQKRKCTCVNTKELPRAATLLRAGLTSTESSSSTEQSELSKSHTILAGASNSLHCPDTKVTQVPRACMVAKHCKVTGLLQSL